MLRLHCTDKPQYYKIHLETDILFKEKKILVTSTEYIWEYSIIEKITYDKWMISLKVLSENQTNIAATRHTTDFLKITNRPLEEIILQLDGNGVITTIENINEVLEKWNSAKTEYLSNKVAIPQEEQKVIDKCDVDFRNLKTVLNCSLLHFIFFSPVYNVHPENTLKRTLVFPSVINSGVPLYNTIRQNLIPKDSYWDVNQYCRHTDYGSGNLRKKYRNELTKFLNAPFDYQFRYDASSQYDYQTGLLQTSTTTITEQASEEYLYTAKVSISLTSNDQLL